MGVMIPKIIHYCWFGNNPLSDLNKRCIDSWRRLLPDYTIKEWNEHNSPLDNDYCRAACERGLWSKVANYVRLHALSTEGGIYFDTDVEVFKNFDPLLGHRCFVGFQLDKENDDWVNNAVLGAEAGHPFIRRCIELTVELFVDTGTFYRSPQVTTMALREIGLSRYGTQQLENGVMVFPTEYFYPYTWFEEFTPACIRKNTYAVHYWEKTWGSLPEAKKSSPLYLLKKRALGFLRTYF
jgi:mannosyltransferase OCH1-like enzyme